MSSAFKKVYFPKIRLQELLARPGGIERNDALKAATENLRSIGGESDTIIERAIAAIEKIAFTAQSELTTDNLKSILEQADQIVTLAGTFGYDALDRVSRDLCDVADGLLQSGLNNAAPIKVHVRALRLFAPGSVPLSGEESESVLEELEKVKAHFNFGPIGS